MDGTATSWSPRFGLLVRARIAGGCLTHVTLLPGVPGDADPEAHPLVAPLLAHLETGRGDLDALPTAFSGTPFEEDVMRLMRAIPAGKTATYGDLARRLGKPGAARAVGQVCARNPLILVYPCHRVVQEGGGLGHYSGEGGVATKRRLLELEGALPPARGGAQARLF